MKANTWWIKFLGTFPVSSTFTQTSLSCLLQSLFLGVFVFAIYVPVFLWSHTQCWPDPSSTSSHLFSSSSPLVSLSITPPTPPHLSHLAALNISLCAIDPFMKDKLCLTGRYCLLFSLLDLQLLFHLWTVWMRSSVTPSIAKKKPHLVVFNYKSSL